MREKRLKNTEWIVGIISLVLLAIGLVALYSATQSTELNEFKKQITAPYFNEQDTYPEFYFRMHTMAYAKLYRKDFIKNLYLVQNINLENYQNLNIIMMTL